MTPDSKSKDPNSIHEVGDFRNEGPSVDNQRQAKGLDDGDATMANETVDTQASTIPEDSINDSSAADNIARSDVDSIQIHLDREVDDFGPEDYIDVAKTIVPRKNVGAVVEEFNTPCDIDTYNHQCHHKLEDIEKTLGTKDCRICFVNERELSMEKAKRC